ncbi:hypothetical protein WK13_34730 [Burkholderia ubonensis]|uniref:hypothetical protein n=1 Tax=Burkholderia ubonensis TaxID=101571 RepID=UPI0007591725|nr:hypothetical protein [Burkholderia ubonensis]KVR21696.1 hypothetical protein WK13_34730 [Burkholderia ubonensis]
MDGVRLAVDEDVRSIIALALLDEQGFDATPELLEHPHPRIQDSLRQADHIVEALGRAGYQVG